MKDDNTLNLNQFLSFEPNDSDGQFHFSSDLESIDDIETFLLNQRDYDTNKFDFDFNFQKNEQKLESTVKKQIYRPKHIRGDGIKREGYCESCDQWFRLKTSSYWYHMNYKHGINSKGQKYPEPELRNKNNQIESFCPICKKWILLCAIRGRKSVKYSWFKHFQKMHNEEFD